MVLKTGESSHRAALLGQGSLLGGRDCQVIIRKASSRTIEGAVLEEFRCLCMLKISSMDFEKEMFY